MSAPAKSEITSDKGTICSDCFKSPKERVTGSCEHVKGVQYGKEYLNKNCPAPEKNCRATWAHSWDKSSDVYFVKDGFYELSVTLFTLRNTSLTLRNLEGQTIGYGYDLTTGRIEEEFLPDGITGCYRWVKAEIKSGLGDSWVDVGDEYELVLEHAF